LTLSHPTELLLRLHWVAIIHGHIRADMAITGGVHSAQDVLKSMMVGTRVARQSFAGWKNTNMNPSGKCAEA
jgi:dihydroorotate dehydrogenase (fumarate)